MSNDEKREIMVIVSDKRTKPHKVSVLLDKLDEDTARTLSDALNESFAQRGINSILETSTVSKKAYEKAFVNKVDLPSGMNLTNLATVLLKD